VKKMDFPVALQTEDFYRYEFKYLLNLEQREAIESELAHFMSYDGHVHKELENAYYIRSLYFDNDVATNFYEKIDGLQKRTKFRLRTYGKKFESDLPIYLEEKNRNGDRVHKRRIKIDYDHMNFFCGSSLRYDLCNIFPEVNIVEQFFFEATRKMLKPTVLIDYIRRPYVSPYDMNFRVTIDSDIMALKGNSLFKSTEKNWLYCLAGYTIMEVKFHRRVPAWFHRILQAHNLRRLSISKFVEGMKKTGLAVDLS
jgi:SPX domain protein involved in polyphosphate accumulation